MSNEKNEDKNEQIKSEKDSIIEKILSIQCKTLRKGRYEKLCYVDLSKVKRSKIREIKPPKKFKCNLCDKKYAQMSSLSRHKIKEHNPSLTNVLFCNYCGKVFYSRYELTVHTYVIFHKHFITFSFVFDMKNVTKRIEFGIFFCKKCNKIRQSILLH